MNAVVSYLEYYLPVFIPLFLTIISVLAGIVMKRIDLSLRSLLKIHSDIVLGLFSFVIWALVAYQQTGAVRLNDDYELGLIRVVLLLFANIILLIAGQIVLNVKWTEFAVEHVRVHERVYENSANALFLGVTVVVIFAPIVLAAPIQRVEPGVRSFAVAVPYFDPSLANQIGPVRWGNRLLCEIHYEMAADKQKAIEQALSAFRSSDRARQFFDNNSSLGPVTVNERLIVATEG